MARKPVTAAAMALVESPNADEAGQMVLNLGPYGELTETGLVISDPEMPYEKWAQLLQFFGRASRTLQWAIGDAILYGEGLYAEKYAQAVDDTGLNQRTLTNYTWVCRHVPPSMRRASLAFSTHAEVAPLDPAKQKEWLDKAEEGGWSRSDLRKAMAEADQEVPAPEQPSWTPEGESAAALLEKAARDVWKTAQREPDSGRYLVEPEPMSRLAAALGED